MEKTQACFKFAQDYWKKVTAYTNQEDFIFMFIEKLTLVIKFWEIFWINARNQISSNHGFLKISQIFGIDKDSKVVKQQLSNIQENRLLIIDNTNDPSIDNFTFFLTSNKGYILLTTCNLDCKIHSNVGF